MPPVTGTTLPLRKPVAIGDPKESSPRGMNWPAVLWILLVHAGALLAPFYFTWSGFILCLALIWVSGSIGVCLGYHRYLTHGGFDTYRPVRWVLVLLGQLSGEGSVLSWVADHRKHHMLSDREGDPHSPRDGALWAHMLWLVPARCPARTRAHYKRFVPDLLKDPVVLFLDRLFLPANLGMALALFLTGALAWDIRTGISFLAWGMFARLLYVFHVTWLVNSATHMWGYRNYETTDNSRNLWWVGLLAFGEGWHNNHHAFQTVARHGHKPWEIDTTYWVICAMEKVGLAWNVVRSVPRVKPGV